MKILVDECLPVRIKDVFKDFDLYTVRELRWTSLKNGALIRKALENDFNIFLTADKKLRYQQNVSEFKISLIVLDIYRNKIEEITELKEIVIEAFNLIKPSEIIVVNKDGITKL